MKVSIFGLGYVGCTMAACLAKEGNTVIGVDINRQKINMLNQGKALLSEPGLGRLIKEAVAGKRLAAAMDYKKAVMDTRVSIICIATSRDRKGLPDLKNVYRAARQIASGLRAKRSFHVIAVKSTVLPGTNSRLSGVISRISGKKDNKDFCVVSNPEFLREGSAVKDHYNAAFIALGSGNKKGLAIMKRLYAGLPACVKVMKPQEAEVLKYANNLFHALKISFANEIGNICKASCINSFKIMELLRQDRRLNISGAYLDPGFAWGGSCLSKDIDALIGFSGEKHLRLALAEAVNKSNDIQKQRLLDLIYSLGKKRIGILGITFKEGTDDVRGSALIEIAKRLLSGGYIVRIFDKRLSFNEIIGSNKAFLKRSIPQYRDIIYKDPGYVIKNSDLVIINQRIGRLDRILKGAKKPIIDLIRIGSISRHKNYIGINW